MTDSRPQLPTNLDVLGKPALQSTLISRAAFWQPRHIWSSRQLKTIPFFFWLVESILPQRILQIGVDDGISFLSFCQSVDKLRLDASCIGLTLDDREAALAKLFEAQEACYPDFSLIENYVSGHLNDKKKHQSIDMLVVGSSVTDSLFSDLRANLFSRLSDNAVVVILDPEQLFFSEKGKEILTTLEAEWSTVKSSNDRSAPLVLFRGPEPSERLLRLSEMPPESPEHLMFWQIFHRLGQGIADSQLATERENAINIIQAKVDQLSNLLEDYENQIAALRTDAKTLRKTEESQGEQITILRTGLGQLQTHQAEQTSKIDELQEKLGEAQEKRQAFYARSTELQKERDELAQSLATRTDDLASLSAEYEMRLDHLEIEKKKQVSQIAKLREKLEGSQEKRQLFYARSVKLQSERDTLKSEVEERIQDIAFLSLDTENRMKELTRDLNIALKNMKKIKGSTSWKLSSPIRKLKKIFR